MSSQDTKNRPQPVDTKQEADPDSGRERLNSGGSNLSTPRKIGALKPTPGSKKTKAAIARKDFMLGLIPLLIAALAIYLGPKYLGQDPKEALKNAKQTIEDHLHLGGLQERYKERFALTHKDNVLTVAFHNCKQAVAGAKEWADEALDHVVSDAANLGSRVEGLVLDSQVCQDLSAEGIKNFVRKAGKISGLKSFTLNLRAYKGLTEDKINEIADVAREALSHIHSLELGLTNHDNFKEKAAAHYGNALAQGFPDLKNLTLNLGKLPAFTDKALQDLAENLAKGVPNLEKLDLYIPWNTRLTDKGIIAVANTLNQYKKLKSLSINLLGNAAVTNKGAKAIIEAIGKSLPQLEELELNFASLKSITDESLFAITSEMLPNLANLHSFSLNLDRVTSVGDNAVTSIVESVGHYLKSVKKFELSFNTLKSLILVPRSLSEVLANDNFSKLEHLSLDFSGCDSLSEESLRSLLKSIGQNLGNLKYLSLNTIDATKPDVVDQAALFTDKLKNLEHLTYKISIDWKKTKYVAADLFNAIGKYVYNVQTLNLMVTNMHTLNNTELEDFANTLKTKFTKVKDLAFALINCEKISNAGIIAVPQALANRGIENLNIQIEKLNFTDSGVAQLGQIIGSGYQDVKKLRLAFIKTDKITDNGMKDLIVEGLGKLHNLEELSVDSVGISISKAIVNRFYDTVLANNHNIRYLQTAFTGLSSGGNVDHSPARFAHLPETNLWAK